MSADAIADPTGAYVPRIHAAEVTGARRLGPGMIRISLGGPDMLDYPTTGVGDEYVRIFFPDEPDVEVRMPFVADRGWDYPEGVEPSEMRTYTIRAHRAGEVDIDFVVHEGGLAADWALQAVPGQRVALNPPQKLYARPESARRQLLIADEPALPAALRIAELTGRQVETTVLVELRGRENALRTEHGEEDPTTYRWLCGTGNGATPSQLLETLRREKLEHDTYVWVAGETRLTREARSYLRHELGLPAEAYKCVGYWTDKAEQWRERYDALGEEFHERLRALYACELDEEEIVDEVQRMYEAVGL
ncbi:MULTISPECIES: siderophore-interacting protein [Brachybacterium]|uniref:siderophore-interacting protein n=1 Tax=Brachybacterium TaxID=43668 RepID=UPI000DF2DAA7|nr:MULTISPECIES: siderophore-interacting protein [Brachybacterium]RCS65501.1 siderophore-interacting protein [Brachybacterium sp. JB7]RCS69654.1 siderophore-interacting protein [Brachybacterium alimentarium]RCS77039.1 siderophore-interacting protein [Brachybacterium alimentarium]RCS78903.1 siderophore-interacting protein [Brachybacterium alimentarium]